MRGNGLAGATPPRFRGKRKTNSFAFYPRRKEVVESTFVADGEVPVAGEPSHSAAQMLPMPAVTSMTPATAGTTMRIRRR
jgi:hypothetical protein